AALDDADRLHRELRPAGELGLGPLAFLSELGDSQLLPWGLCASALKLQCHLVLRTRRWPNAQHGENALEFRDLQRLARYLADGGGRSAHGGEEQAQEVATDARASPSVGATLPPADGGSQPSTEGDGVR